MGFKYNSGYMGNLAETEQKQRNDALWKSSEALGGVTRTSDATSNSVNNALSSYYGANGMSNWKRGQINTRTGATTANYNNALSSNRLRARSAGFGYEQPSEQMAETNIENARASDLSKISGDVEAEAVPIEQNAINLRLQSGQQQQSAYAQQAAGELGIAGEYSPETYYQTAIGQDEAAKARKASLWKSLIGAGTSIATGGVSGLWGSK
jgi:hypothetical protein